MNKYRIEIWRYHSVRDRFSSNDILSIRDWWFDNWYTVWDYGECAFYVYENDRKMSFKELGSFSFYDDPLEEG